MQNPEAPKGLPTALHLQPDKLQEYKDLMKVAWKRWAKEEGFSEHFAFFRRLGSYQFAGYVDAMLNLANPEGELDIAEAKRVLKTNLEGMYKEDLFVKAVNFIDQDHFDYWKS